MIYKSLLILFFISAGLCYSFAQQNNDLILVKNDEYKISLDNDLLLKILSLKDGTAESLAYSNIFNFVLDLNENHISNFSVIDKSEEREKTQFGNSTVIYIKSANENKTLLNNFKIIIPDSFENTLIFKSDLKNNSNLSLHISKMIFCQMNLDARNLGSQKSYEFWSFQPQSTPDRADWIQPISENHYQKKLQQDVLFLHRNIFAQKRLQKMLTGNEKIDYGEKGRWIRIHMHKNYIGTRIILDYLLQKWKYVFGE
jgi:hypothetical protein